MNNKKAPLEGHKEPQKGAIKNHHSYYSTDERLLSTLTDKPLPRAYLCTRLGVTDRELRRAVERLRRQGYPIVADCGIGGYKLGTEEEVRVEAAKLLSRAKELTITAEKMMEGMDDGQ